jgi:hypothetical protein
MFIVGAAKCGTTSLVDALADHPEIFVPKVKEPMLFIPEIGVRNLDSYLSLYNGVRQSQVAVDASTGYLYHENAAQSIYRFNPTSKILIVLRNPVNAMYSLWQYMNTMGNEKESFVEAVLDTTRRHGEDFRKECVGWYANYLYAERYRYASQVKRYLAVFPPENVHIVLFEELILNPERELNEILAYLGLSAGKLKLPRSNESGRPRSRYLKSILDKKGRFLGKLVPRRYKAALRVALSKINTSAVKRHATGSELRIAAAEVDFDAELLELEKTLGRSLDLWRAQST